MVDVDGCCTYVAHVCWELGASKAPSQNVKHRLAYHGVPDPSAPHPGVQWVAFKAWREAAWNHGVKLIKITCKQAY